jgi:hypothetical protein
LVKHQSYLDVIDYYPGGRIKQEMFVTQSLGMPYFQLQDDLLTAHLSRASKKDIPIWALSVSEVVTFL